MEQLRAALADRYDIERELGRGGMAIVYLATDRKHQRRVAIKVVQPGLGVELGTELLLAEIQIVARLSHPNIVPVYDSGEANGTLFFVMPFVEGESLRHRLTRERQLPLDEALHIARGVAAGLAYAHARGIVHRDIKPENVMLASGEPMVADFGIAAVMREVGGGISSDLIVGTPAYMSPEQCDADALVDGRSDLYSLGCTLYEMLAGSPPFPGPSALAITASKLADPVPKVSRLRETVPPGVEHVLERCLAKSPADRFATAHELARALAAAASAGVAAPEAADPRSIAVLPFANVGGDPENEFLSDGLSEELTHALGRVDGLRVVARTSAFAFKGWSGDVREIGRRLGVGAVLEGSVRRAGKHLRVVTQLVDVAKGFQLWSERYDKTAEDVFAVQDDIAHAVVDALRPALLGAAVPRFEAAGTSYEAYEAYLRGRHAWNRRSEEGLREAMAHFERSAVADPHYALAHAGLADSCTTLGIYGIMPPAELAPRAQAAAERAVALGPALAEARTALAAALAIFRWDWQDADREFRHAIALNPQYTTALHWRAINCLAPQGRLKEARADLERALVLDPLSASAKVSRALISYFERDHDRALAECDEVLGLEPRFGMARYFGGLALAALGRDVEAQGAFREAMTLVGRTAEITSALAWSLALAGEEDQARGLLADLAGRTARGYVSPVMLAQVHLGLG
ncbi:MAG TPA: protein kinase, partial [Gemmatimonadales bacterium]|nr:protein kinase [Gemmatimonadales bacterium]